MVYIYYKVLICVFYLYLSTKITMDFVSPENIQQCIRLTEEFCKLPVNHKAKEDKLEVTFNSLKLITCLNFDLQAGTYMNRLRKLRVVLVRRKLSS
ncbi:hypothetical protein Hanom_Chr00s000002g01600581 [Helianthus anomalus]